eukprot:7843064-Pyramimonas_sp.AAC.1
MASDRLYATCSDTVRLSTSSGGRSKGPALSPPSPFAVTPALSLPSSPHSNPPPSGQLQWVVGRTILNKQLLVLEQLYEHAHLHGEARSLDFLGRHDCVKGWGETQPGPALAREGSGNLKPRQLRAAGATARRHEQERANNERK